MSMKSSPLRNLTSDCQTTADLQISWNTVVVGHGGTGCVGPAVICVAVGGAAGARRAPKPRVGYVVCTRAARRANPRSSMGLTASPGAGQARGEHPTVPHVACAAAPLRSPDRLSSRRITRAAIYKGWWQCLRGPETPSEGGRRGGARRQTICRGNASYAYRDEVGSGSCRHWLTGRKGDERARVATVCR